MTHSHHNHSHSHNRSHSHNHSHSHHSLPDRFDRAFLLSVGLNIAFTLIEVTYGLLGNSLALIADAGHNLSDVLGLLLAWGASWLVRRRASLKRTYGLRKASILAPLANAVLLLIASGGIIWEAIQRFQHPEAVASGTMMVIAAIGILINGGSALLFFKGRHTDVNLRGAFLHLAADAIASVGVVLAGLLIAITHWNWIDPIASLLVTMGIIWGAWDLLNDSLHLAVDGVPKQIDAKAVYHYLAELPIVERVHDLHIWAMSSTETALTAHLVIPSGNPGDAFLADLYHHLHSSFGIDHPTIQIEMGDGDALHRCETRCNPRGFEHHHPM
ncbi:cation diffusion facilitator family transporter [Alkalinema sp. FACHB-956]|uniref:cation diffusion facilitator family transporter n=1 Tax=Alkalinema sp. FACHB-956 TaxID=2692768 RepID=UPI001687C80B|nr:cation diffusion facilitator family transporter [Alkalinema sp. FACHB-956]MBD2326145.1 cation transporter [Alkalinema sp. FACHB-956]